MADLVAVTSALVGLTDAERLFCEQVVKTNDPLKAWITARVQVDPRYTREVQVERLMELPQIKTAIEELRKIEPAPRPIRKTREALDEDVEDIYGKALGDKDYTNALKAKQLQAQLRGMLVEKREITVTSDPDKITSADLKAFIAREIEKQNGKLIDVTPVKDDGGS